VSVEGRRVLITGGTGSLGSTLVRRILTGEMGRPARLTVFSRDEAKQHELRLQYLHRREATDDVIYQSARELLRFRIGDVRDYAAVLAAVREADVIFHAAALKQVPTCEYFPIEAIQTNVGGAGNLVRAVRESGGAVETVVGVSTDKACQPINVMGMTKALQERLIVQANLECPTTRFMCVRYGNVLASRGSVIPLFLEQIRQGGPVTITLPQMTRFLLTLDEAVDTVFAALRTGLPGDTYVPRAPSALMTDLAAVLIDGRDIPIVETGIRPGEKLHEVMVSDEECHRSIERGGYYVICPVLPELRRVAIERPARASEYSSSEVTLDRPALRRLLAPYLADPALPATA
jgi:UDP-glucose 4-epimerase